VDAIDTIKKEDRNFSSSTLLVSKELYEDFKKEMHHFRKRIVSMTKECKSPEMVCYTGFQLLRVQDRYGHVDSGNCFYVGDGVNVNVLFNFPGRFL